MSFGRKFNRANERKRRQDTMRYINLKVTAEDRARIKARGDGEEQFKNGIFGQVEMLRKLMEFSPKCTGMSDLTQLVRMTRKLEKIEDSENPVLELPEDEWEWAKKILDHDQYSKYGPQFIHVFGELLEAVTEAKTERSEGQAIKLVETPQIGASNA